MKHVITVTEALTYVLPQGAGDLTSVTTVPISKDPLIENQGSTENLFKFATVELRTYY